MQFIDNAPNYKIIRITGPQHNILGLRLSESPSAGKPIIEILNVSEEKAEGISGEEVLAQVIFGVNQASLECNRQFFVEKIQYITTDSLPVDIYSYLAAEIIRRVVLSQSTQFNG